MWTMEKTKRVDRIIDRLTDAKDKDDLGEALMEIEEETGCTCEFIYDIFTEAVIDEEVNLNEAPRTLVESIWRGVVEPAFEFDY